MLALVGILDRLLHGAADRTLTFLGKPRSEGAAHAPESVRSMTIPLMLIAPFAVALGWFGIPASFPLLGGLVPNWIEHVLEPYIDYMGFELRIPAFSPSSCSSRWPWRWAVWRWAGSSIARGCPKARSTPCAAGWGRSGGPCTASSGWMKLYDYTIVPFTRSGEVLCTGWMTCGSSTRSSTPSVVPRSAIARFCREVDRYVVDGVVNLPLPGVDRAGCSLRNAQNGQVQVYLMVVAVSLMIWLLLTALPMMLTLV
jgi:hypothetical protein